MTRPSPRLTAVAALVFCGPLLGQEVTGTWQGTLNSGGKELRMEFRISPAEAGILKATMYSIDENIQPQAAIATVQGSTIKLSVPSATGAYEGKLTADRLTVTGTWNQGSGPLPLNLTHVPDEQAWPIPDRTGGLKPMAADADPSFEVVSIKPAGPEEPARINYRGREFTMTRMAAIGIVGWAYTLSRGQLSGYPGWSSAEFYDVTAKPDAEGRPNLTQWKIMGQKMLADRFQLKFHREQKEVPVYAMVVAKDGSKLLPSGSDPTTNGTRIPKAPGDFPVKNSTLTEFAQSLQAGILDRPVIDQTGLTGKFDFELKWTPDASQYGGRGAQLAPTDNPDAPPDIFTAMQQQLGLKLVSTNAMIDFVVIDHLEKPSGN
jgi:uncharacterized protein (TIGR03435 family)